MKLAVISLMNGSPWGGSEALWYALAEYSLEQNDEVFVSVYDWNIRRPMLEELKKKGAVISYRKLFNSSASLAERIKRSVLKRVPSFDQNYQSIIAFKPDHIFISQGDSFDLAVHHIQFYDLIKKSRIPYSIVCHGHDQYGIIPDESIWKKGPEIFTNAKNIFFVSQRQRLLAERRILTRLTNAHFTWNPLNLQIPGSPLPWPDPETFSMAIVGGIVKGKGHDTALELLGAEAWKGRNWKLNIYGVGAGEEYLKKAASFFNVSDRIFFNGFTNDIAGLWKKNQLLLIPSSGEGLPISLAEAMACGRGAVVTDTGGNAELVQEGISGFVAASPTVESFGSALEKAWDSKHILRQIGLNAFERINEVLDRSPEKTIYDQLFKGYSKAK